MHRWWRRALLGIWMCFGGLASTAAATEADRLAWIKAHPSLTVGILRDDWAPYHFYRSGQMSGLSVDYLAALTKGQGIVLHPKVYGSKPELFDAVCRGEVDVVLNVRITPDKTACMAFSEPYITALPVFAARKDDPRHHNEGSLPSARIAYDRDTAAEDWLRHWLPTATGMPVASTREGLQRVEQGGADVYLGDPYAIAYAIGNDRDARLGIYAQTRITNRSLHFAVPKNRLPLLEVLNDGLRHLTPAEVRQLQSRWLNQDMRDEWFKGGLTLTPEDRQWLSTLPPLKLGIDPDWAPIAYVDANGRPDGIVADYLDHISAALGIRFTVVPTDSWEQTLALAQSGQLDAIVPVNALPEGNQTMVYTQPFIKFSDVIVTRPQASPQGIEDLAGRHILVSDPNELSGVASDLIPGARITVARTARDAMKMVASGEADAYIGNSAVADFNIRDHFPGALKIASPANITSAQSIAIHWRYARLAPLINQVIAAIPEKEQQRIRSTWLWSHYTAGLPWRTFWKATLLVGLSVVTVLSILLTAHFRLRREIRQRLNAERELADQSRFREALMESLPYPVAAKDDANRYVAVNRAYEAAFGIPRDALIGKTTLETAQFDSEWNRRFHAIGEEVQRNQQPYHAELRLRDEQHGERYWLYWIHPFKLSSGLPGGLLVALVDVTSIREAERRARVLDQRLKRVTTHLPAVVFELRRAADGRLSFPYVGGNTRAMWDLDAATMEADERTAFSRVHPDDQAPLAAAVERSALTLEPISIDFRSMAHGRERWIHSDATPQVEEDGTIFWSGVWVDVTDTREQAVALAAAKEEAEAAAAAKANFLATMSHEIRTPMNGVIGMLELLRDGPLNYEQQRMLRMIGESATALMQILNDVLDFSKIDAGQLEMVQEPVDLRALLDSVSGVAGTLAHDKGLYVRNAVDARVAVELDADGVRLRQILFNLLSNAIKFTEEGEIGVRVEAIDTSDARQHIRLTVHDTGIGMTEAQRQGLFEPFAQADASIARRFGGTGLGLAICRSLVELMDGTIRMESAPGAGTRVIVDLNLPIRRLTRPTPLQGKRVRIEWPDDAGAAALRELLLPLGVRVVLDEAADIRFVDEGLSASMDIHAPMAVVTDEPSPLGYVIEPDGTCLLSRNPLMSTAVEATCLHLLGFAPQAPSVPDRRVEGQHPGLILVAEDHPINRQVIQQQLQRLGYAAVVVPDGREALKALASHDVALLITDCAMPEMDGYALARHIRSQESPAQHLPILALTASALPDEAERCADAGMDALLVKPASLEQLKKSLQRWMPAPPAQASDAPAPPAALTALFGERVDLSTLVEGFVLTTRDDLDSLRAAMASGDAGKAADCIHRIGGASKMFGADAVAERGERLREALLRHGLHGYAEELEAYLADVARLLDTMWPPPR
jgi:PAS domain S-box-containing protein